MTLLPLLLVSLLAGYLVYRDTVATRAARRFVRVDYSARKKRGRLRRY